MADILALRQYQREAVDAVFKAHANGVRRPAVVLPTGSGKTVLFSHLAREHQASTGTRSLILVHRDELADQAMRKIVAVAPHLSVGKVKAADNEVDADVVVASVQTISRDNRLAALTDSQLGGVSPFGLVITDECHHGLSPSYRKVYEAFSSSDHVGVTATLARTDGIGLGTVWDDVVYTKSIGWMVSKGHLVMPRAFSVETGIDLKNVKKSAGDFQASGLGTAMQDTGAVPAIVSAWLEQGEDRPTLAFLPTVATAQETAAEFRTRGVAAEIVSGETPREDRLRIYENSRTGRTRVVVNCMVLTEGADLPWISCVVMARPTQSQPLYIQVVGRGLRTFPGKTDCLVLDVVGSSENNRLVTLIDLEEGLFPDRKPCRECFRIPCVCPCGSCGIPKPCGCPAAERDIRLTGTGKNVDLFAASRSAWLRTRAGVMFVPAGDAVVALWPDGDDWTVALVPRQGKWERLRAGLPLEAAMSWAEVEAEDRGEVIALRGASWRKRRVPPTEPQLKLCRSLRVPVPEDAGKAQVSDLISVALASRTIDPYVRSST